MADIYDDIINMPRWEPKNRQRMAMANRAAQFAPFAALTGHDEAIKETARLTESIHELDMEAMKVLNEKMALLTDNISLQPEIEVRYFIPDARKSGGSYTTHKGSVRRIDDAGQTMVFTDGTLIPVSSVGDLRGEIFEEIDSRE